MVTTNHESDDDDLVSCRLGYLLGPGTGEVDWLAAWLGPAIGERDKPAATWPVTTVGVDVLNASLVRLPSCRWEPTCDAVGRKPNGVTYPAGIPTCAADPFVAGEAPPTTVATGAGRGTAGTGGASTAGDTIT